MSRTQEDIQDELLVLQCQEGDEDALKALIARWQPRLSRLAWRLTAYRIVTNKCTDWTRRRIVQRNATKELQDEAASQRCHEPSEADAGDDVALLRATLAQLPEQQRAILSLHYLDGMGVMEIARVFGVPPGTVKSRLHHARHLLKQALERMNS